LALAETALTKECAADDWLRVLARPQALDAFAPAALGLAAQVTGGCGAALTLRGGDGLWHRYRADGASAQVSPSAPVAPDAVRLEADGRLLGWLEPDPPALLTPDARRRLAELARVLSRASALALDDCPYTEVLLHEVVRRVSGITGDAWFPELVRTLAELLGVDAVFVAERVAGAPATVRSLAGWGRGELAAEQTCDLTGHPAAEVLAGATVYRATGLAGETVPAGCAMWASFDSFLGVPLRDPDGAVTGLLALLHHAAIPHSATATALIEVLAARASAELGRRRSEDALRASEERYRVLVEVCPDPILLHAGGRVVFVNPAAVELLGAATAQEVVGRPVVELMDDADRPIVRERIQRMLATGQREPLLEERVIRADGTRLEVEVAAAPLRYGDEPAVLVVARDISDRRLAQEHQRAALLGQLARSVAHDMNNVLQTVLTAAQMGLASDDPTFARRCLELVVSAAGDGAERVRRAQEISRAQEPPPPAAAGPAPEPPAETTPEPAGELGPAAGARRVLVVEDEASLLEMLTLMLRTLGYDVRTACDAPEAMRLFAAEPFDLVLTDYGLPGAPGTDVARQCKAQRPGTKVILATGWGAEVARGEADLVLTKPFAARQLAAAIRELLGADAPHRP